MKALPAAILLVSLAGVGSADSQTSRVDQLRFSLEQVCAMGRTYIEVAAQMTIDDFHTDIVASYLETFNHSASFTPRQLAAMLEFETEGGATPDDLGAAFHGGCAEGIDDIIARAMR